MRIGSIITTTSIALLSAGLALSSVHKAFADDTATTPTPAPSGSTSGGSVIDESQNNRQKTLQGSKSPFSLQFNLTYNGSSLIHPLAQEVPNADHQIPAPTANLSGFFSGRYRLDASTTMGVGAGITIYTPFQGPTNTSVANPYADIAHAFQFWGIKNRADFQATVFTDRPTNQDYGYTTEFTALNEAFYEFKSGFTAGFLVEFDYNTFSGKPQYQSNYNNPGFLVGNSGTLIGPEGPQQTQWDLQLDPYFEYALNETFNLRSVIGWVSNNTRDMPGDFDLNHQPIYQTLGLGTQVTKSVFLYTFIFGVWEQLDARDCTVGLNAIINIF